MCIYATRGLLRLAGGGSLRRANELRREAVEKKRIILAAGDFNAVLGPMRKNVGEDRRAVGIHRIGKRNPRGDTLVRWATLEGLSYLTRSSASVLKSRGRTKMGAAVDSLIMFCWNGIAQGGRRTLRPAMI